MLEQLRRKYIGDRNFYKSYIALALPMILQNAVTNLVSFLDNIMVGQLGTEQMSGVAIVNQLIFGHIRGCIGSQHFRRPIFRKRKSQRAYVFVPF